tara:strand:+ start:4099 stop:5457 length:1359 start_codon:yes stop_codon:yes gene_type:complete
MDTSNTHANNDLNLISTSSNIVINSSKLIMFDELEKNELSSNKIYIEETNFSISEYIDRDYIYKNFYIKNRGIYIKNGNPTDTDITFNRIKFFNSFNYHFNKNAPIQTPKNFLNKNGITCKLFINTLDKLKNDKIIRLLGEKTTDITTDRYINYLENNTTELKSNISDINVFSNETEINEILEGLFNVKFSINKYKTTNDYLLKSLYLLYCKITLDTEEYLTDEILMKKGVFYCKDTQRNKDIKLIKSLKLEYDQISIENKRKFFAIMPVFKNKNSNDKGVVFKKNRHRVLVVDYIDKLSIFNYHYLLNVLFRNNLLSIRNLINSNDELLNFYFENYFNKIFTTKILLDRYSFSFDTNNINRRIKIETAENKELTISSFKSNKLMYKCKFECSICFSNSNIDNKCIKKYCSIKKCKNKICLECVKKLDECPYCRTTIKENIKSNFKYCEYYI